MPNQYGQHLRDPCAYCALHHFAMTFKEVQGRKCLQKHCKHFRYIKHRVWQERQERQANRAARKEARQEVLQRGRGKWK